jgi:hypothetical protein
MDDGPVGGMHILEFVDAAPCFVKDQQLNWDLARLRRLDLQ